ncbi:hypothetical protein XPA_008001 [Xanthoria parietina]
MPSNIVKQLADARTAIHYRIFHPSNWQSVSQRQSNSQIVVEPASTTWVSRVSLPTVEDDGVRQALFQTIRLLGAESDRFEEPSSSPVKGEWVGHRLEKATGVPEPCMSERSKYMGMMKDISVEVTMLYVHGGAHYGGSPAQSRPLTAKLANLTGGRCFSLEYRLSPQHAFPSALLDLLHAYLHLLYPIPSASTFHNASSASSIVLTGDSVGANLCLATIQVILSLARQQHRCPPLVTWNGRSVPLHLPAGVALISPWVDSTWSLPSHKNSFATDYLPTSSPFWDPRFPQCELWPTEPPRADVYCDDSCLLHPLVSPVVADDWRGAPPMLVVGGEEAPSDGIKITAQQAFGQGVPIRWIQFEKMPHVFMLLLGRLEHSKLAMKEWAEFCRIVVEQKDALRAGGEFIKVQDLSRHRVDLAKLTELSREDAILIMRNGMNQRPVVERTYTEPSKL